MITNIKHHPFKPFTLELQIENLEDLMNLLARFNTAPDTINRAHNQGTAPYVANGHSAESAYWALMNIWEDYKESLKKS